jgi:hypothetical protein
MELVTFLFKFRIIFLNFSRCCVILGQLDRRKAAPLAGLSKEKSESSAEIGVMKTGFNNGNL